MKITKIEKIIMGTIVFLLIAMIGSCSMFLVALEDAGGAKQVLIDTGKELKDINRQINQAEDDA